MEPGSLAPRRRDMKNAPCPECGRGSVYRYGARRFIALIAR
ncbi:MAG TPA: hypothetical protein VF950_17275 [Planctomycetota bacterium]